MLTVDFIDDDGYTSHEEQQEISRLLNFAFGKLESGSNAEISVSFVDNTSIREINHQYRDKDEVTDVISFAMEDDEFNLIHEEAPRTLGDIIISTDRAGEQAEEYGHSYRRELLFLSLHGFLHLLGYDHLEEAEEREMNRTQDEILEAFGVSRDE
ncbi:rRNA maturation RNase YbeY [Lacicoccus alkaliphilus]|uniref:Endoribonuclease YbeY n=1 Tax=Lacicoccus alkaliphilus DSM 16010 TaxID=1123231 RepID=A0A1M7BLS4_9BACL|nr:rRNA maturation RNase YbeY [Salinicoccus alkaliphilus]SHL55816.1 probable rRNA maturation factor [Salinicoccus alkaliphilus DSM 16010]